MVQTNQLQVELRHPVFEFLRPVTVGFGEMQAGIIHLDMMESYF
jgi:hypothetical protein